MAALNDDQRIEAVNIGFQLAKFGIEQFMGRKLAREEEQELLDHLREKEAAREFKTPDELLQSSTRTSELTGGVTPGATGDEE